MSEILKQIIMAPCLCYETATPSFSTPSDIIECYRDEQDWTEQQSKRAESTKLKEEKDVEVKVEAEAEIP